MRCFEILKLYYQKKFPFDDFIHSCIVWQPKEIIRAPYGWWFNKTRFLAISTLLIHKKLQAKIFKNKQ